MSDYVANELLSRLVGFRMYSIEFVGNWYVQLRFDSEGSTVNPYLNCDVWPTIEVGERVWRETELGYADVMRRLLPGVVLSTEEATGKGLRIELEGGTIVLHPDPDEVYVEIALLSGFEDGRWMCWRSGEDSFEDLV